MAFLLIAETCIKITLLQPHGERRHERGRFIYNQNMFGPRSSADLLAQEFNRLQESQKLELFRTSPKPSHQKLQNSKHNEP